jgi:hypothetical protein
LTGDEEDNEKEEEEEADLIDLGSGLVVGNRSDCIEPPEPSREAEAVGASDA